jgi:hypothetical protein
MVGLDLYRHEKTSTKATVIKCLSVKMSDIEQFVEKARSVLSEFQGDPNLTNNADDTIPIKFAILTL